MINVCFLPFKRPCLISLATSAKSKSCSGIKICSAPLATPVQSAISPARRPITSTINVRTCDVAVSRRRSSASNTVLMAVSKPIVYSVPGISLSIVPGTPTVGKPSFVKATAP